MRYTGDQFTTGTYSGNALGGDKITKDIEKADGAFVSFGEDLAFTSNGTNVSGATQVNSVTYNAEGDIIQIDIDYNFSWDGTEILGSYSGEVGIDLKSKIDFFCLFIVPFKREVQQLFVIKPPNPISKPIF